MLFKDDKTARLDAQTIRQSVGWYRWTHDLVEVTGADALDVLQKIYVSDLSKVPAGKTKYTAMLNEDGEIIDDVIVMHMEEGKYWISTLYGPRLEPWVQAHTEGEDIAFRLITYDWDMFAIQGPDSPAAMAQLTDKPVADMKRFCILISTQRVTSVSSTAEIWLGRLQDIQRLSSISSARSFSATSTRIPLTLSITTTIL